MQVLLQNLLHFQRERCEWVHHYLLPVLLPTASEIEDMIMVSVQPPCHDQSRRKMTRQVGWPFIFISPFLKAKLSDSTLYLQPLYISPPASWNYPHTFIRSSFNFCLAIIFCYFTFSTFLPSAVSLHRLISVCFPPLLLFSLFSLWNKYGSCSLKDHLMTHSL